MDDVWHFEAILTMADGIFASLGIYLPINPGCTRSSSKSGEICEKDMFYPLVI